MNAIVTSGDSRYPDSRDSWHATRAAAWIASSDVYGSAIRSYHAEKGRRADDEAVRSTVRTNTELVPQRGDALLRLLGQLTGVTTLRDREVLEAGCGFGALASYLAWTEEPSRLVGIDVRDDFVSTASAAATRLGIDRRLSFGVADMSRLSDMVAESFDVVIANNALLYVTPIGLARRALEEFARVLRPGGALLVYQANRWRVREPFTGDPFVHLLRPRLADAAGRVFGWRHNHGRVLLLSPPSLVRLVRRAGFIEVRTAAGGRDYGPRDPRRFVSHFLALGARAP